MTAMQSQKQANAVSIGDDGALNHEVTGELPELWIDRDLSWLEFNERVLAEALDNRNPLLERAKFLAIFTSNLDEFFMKRVAVLRQSFTADREKLLQEINVRLLPALHKQAACLREQIVPGLAAQGVFLRHWQELTPGAEKRSQRVLRQAGLAGPHAAGDSSGRGVPVSIESVDFARFSARG
jgi:polyphosphate kinase